jgi:hypothetical protein
MDLSGFPQFVISGGELRGVSGNGGGHYDKGKQ